MAVERARGHAVSKRAPPAREVPDRAGPRILYGIALLHAVAFSAFLVMRQEHLGALESDDDPLWAWRTAGLASSFSLWLLGLAGCALRFRRRKRVPMLVWTWLVLASFGAVGYLVGVFLYPDVG